MAQAARRKTGVPAARPRPRLRVVEAPARVPRDARARVRADEARARTIFGIFLAALVALAVLGSARVALIVRATEMSISETELQRQIKAQRVEGDELEVDRSALSTPSRIESIASATMQMGRPRSVTYMTLPGGEASATPEASSPRGASPAGDTGVGALVGAVLDISAGEARSLLVGELGLAGAR